MKINLISGHNEASAPSERARALLMFLAILLVAVGFWQIKILYEPPRKVSVETVDLYQVFVPWYEYMAAQLREFSLPTWFPYAGGGMPFMATLNIGIFYPPNLLYVLLPSGLTMGLLAQFHLVLAGLGTYGFCRLHHMRRSACLLAAVAYMLSNAVWSYYGNPNYLAGVAWLPVVFLLCERLYVNSGLRDALLLAVGISLQFLCGAAQFFIYTIYFSIFYMGLRLFSAPRQEAGRAKSLRIAFFFAGSGALALLVCGAQILPTIRLLGQSVRAEAFSEPSVHFLGWHFHWWRPFLAVLDSHYVGFFENLFHQGGLLQMFFVVVALTAFRERGVGILAAICVLSMLLSTGHSTPLYKYFALLPGVGVSRQPNRLAFVTAFSLAFLQGRGLEAFMADQEPGTRERVRNLTRVIVAAAALGLILWLTRTRANLAFLGAGGAVLALGVLVRPPRFLRTAGVVIIALSVWEMGVRASPTGSHPQVFPDYLTASDRKVLEHLRRVAGNQRVFIEERGVPPRPFPSVLAAVPGLHSIGNYHSAILSRTAQINRAIMGRPLAYPDGRIELAPDSARPGIFNLLSVRYLLVHRKDNIFESAEPGSPMKRFAKGLQPAYEYPAYLLYENTNAVPRAYMVHMASVKEGPDDALRAILSDWFVPHAAVVLEGEGASEIPPLLSGRPSSDRVEITSYSPHRVVLEVSSKEGGLVVLTDSFYPGWRAAVDGTPAPIYRANYLFRAVYVPAGSHAVQFLYRSNSFLLGLGLSSAGVLCLASGLFFVPVRRSRETDTGPPAAIHKM